MCPARCDGHTLLHAVLTKNHDVIFSISVKETEAQKFSELAQGHIVSAKQAEPGSEPGGSGCRGCALNHCKIQPQS